MVHQTVYFLHMLQTTTRIYLDYAATTPISIGVAEVMQACSTRAFGNASSAHSYGREAKAILEESRTEIAQCIAVEPGEVCFTSGGTEADNHALIGTVCAAKRKTGKSHLIVSSIEHHAVLACADYLAAMGCSVSIVPVGGSGVVDPADVERCITRDTCLISVMHVNNEIGTIQPVEAIGAVAHEHGIVFHTDGVQAMGKIPLSFRTPDVDLLSLTAHKIHGPKGVGALVIRRGTEVDSLIHGGAQERNRRAGTENIPLVAGFARAVSTAIAEIEEAKRHTQQMRDRVLGKIKASVGDLIVNGDPKQTVPSILSISLDGKRYAIESETLLIAMDLRGIAVSSGSACSSGSVQMSHVLQAMGMQCGTAHATIRFSFDLQTTQEEVESAAEAFIDIALHAALC